METIASYWTAGGPLMWPLALLSLATWYWMTSLHEKLRASGAGPSEIEPLLERLAGRASGLEGARALVASSPGAVSRVVDHLMRGGMTPEAVRGRASEAIAAEVGPVERELTVLRAMVAAAPLLGLLGTVMGMIATFSALAARGTASTEMLSAGISEALVTTQVGLVVALPGIFGAHAIRRRLDEVAVALERAVAHLVGFAGASNDRDSRDNDTTNRDRRDEQDSRGS